MANLVASASMFNLGVDVANLLCSRMAFRVAWVCLSLLGSKRGGDVCGLRGVVSLLSLGVRLGPSDIRSVSLLAALSLYNGVQSWQYF